MGIYSLIVPPQVLNPLVVFYKKSYNHSNPLPIHAAF